MLTLKFESPSRGSGPDIEFVTQTGSYRCRKHQGGGVDVCIENEHGVEIAHPVNGSVGGYDRCYVMNSDGRTIDKITATMDPA